MADSKNKRDSSYDNLPEIPGYKIEKRIGRGGMADVYKGIQLTLNRPVAIKIISASFSRDPSFSKRFLLEAQTVAKLVHPNIVTIHDIGSHKENHYIVMEYLDMKLNSRLKYLGKISIEESLRIIKALAAAIKYAHAKGIIHRDIKPDNCMFRTDETPVLVDFGLAKTVDAETSISQTGIRLGTPNYMSPEQCMGKKLDHRTDIYSLGVMFYKMLTGSAPYDTEETIGLMYQHIQAPVPKLPAEFAEYQGLLDRMMDKDRDKRIQDASELISVIEQYQLGDTAVIQTAAETQKFDLKETEYLERPINGSGSRKKMIGIIAASVIIVLIGIFFVFLNPGDGFEQSSVEKQLPGTKEETGTVEKKVNNEDAKTDPKRDMGGRLTEFNQLIDQAEQGLLDKEFDQVRITLDKAKQIHTNHRLLSLEQKLAKLIESESEKQYKDALLEIYILLDKKQYKVALKKLDDIEEQRKSDETEKLRESINNQLDKRDADRQKRRKQLDEKYRGIISEVNQLKESGKPEEALKRLDAADKLKRTRQSRKLRRQLIELLKKKEAADLEKKKSPEKSYREQILSILSMKEKGQLTAALAALDKVEAKIKTSETDYIRSEILKEMKIRDSEKAIKRIGYLDLKKKVQKKYLKRIRRIKFENFVPGLRIDGQVGLTLEINHRGMVQVREVYDKWIKVSSGHTKQFIKTKLIERFKNLRFPQPKDKKGGDVILEKWAITFKIVMDQSTLLLDKQT